MKLEHVKVSVIIPVFNVEAFLHVCLNSVCKQTLNEIEVLCINDASTDKSTKIIEEFCKIDERFRMVSIEKSGQGYARNLGIRLAKGEYIGFVDGDDEVHPEMFDQLYNAAVDNNSEISYCMTECFDVFSNKTIEFPYFEVEKKHIGQNYVIKTYQHSEFIHLLPFTTVVAWNRIYKKSFLTYHEIKFAEGLIQEDIPFTFHALLRANSITVVNKRLYRHSLNRSSSTMNTIREQNFNHIFKIIEQTEEIISDDLLNDTIRHGYELFKVKELTDSLNRVFRSQEIKKRSKMTFFKHVNEIFSKLKMPENMDIYYKIQFKIVCSGMYHCFRLKVSLDLAKERLKGSFQQ